MVLRRLCPPVATFSLILLAGCASKFTRERFEMIQVGVDDREDVRQIIGKPTADLTDQWFYDDLDQHYSAVIYFDESGRVRGKEWMDAATGEWQGRHPDTNEPPRGEVRERHKKTRRIDDD